MRVKQIFANTPKPKNCFATKVDTQPIAKRVPLQQVWGSSPTVSICNLEFFLAESVGEWNSRAFCLPAATCCCSMSPPTTSTLTQKTGCSTFCANTVALYWLLATTLNCSMKQLLVCCISTVRVKMKWAPWWSTRAPIRNTKLHVQTTSAERQRKPRWSRKKLTACKHWSIALEQKQQKQAWRTALKSASTVWSQLVRRPVQKIVS